MSAVAQTRIFGIRLGLDPKFLVLGLIVVAGLLFWYNSRDDEEGTAHSTVKQAVQPATVPATIRAHPTRARRSNQTNEHATLRVRPIDAANGDVDPTLRLSLLERLQSVSLPTGERNVFESRQEALAAEQQAALAKAPKIMPGPLPPTVPAMNNTPPPLNIPLKYYGFAKSASKTEPNSGFFLDGDNVLVGSEGDLLQKRYLVVELTANNARLEDTQVKQGQTLQVVPEAAAQ
jgi:hypothetical protein